MVLAHMNEEDIYLHLETDDAEEWMYYTVMGYDNGAVRTVGVIRGLLLRIVGAGHGEYVVGAVEEALNVVPAGEDAVTENGSGSVDGTMKVVMQTLVGAGAAIKFEDGYAASELLAALLGNPGLIYECVITPTDDAAINASKIEFERQVREIGQDHEDKLRQLVPRALEVVKKLKGEEAMKAMGILMGEHDNCVRAWLDACGRLEQNLAASQ